MYSRRWLIAAVMACALSSACSEFNTNLTVQTSSSSITYLSPSTAVAGQQGFTINVSGGGFTSGAIILWNAGAANQVSLTTTIVGSNLVTAPVPASYVAAAGVVPIAVQIPGSAVSGSSSTSATTTTEISNISNFTINPSPGPTPTISSLSAPPGSQPAIPYCTSPNGFTLTISGANLVNGSVAYWNGSPRMTTFVSATQVTAATLPTDSAFSGAAGITVSNSAGISNTMPFTMTTPPSLAAPSISSIVQTAILPNSQVGTATSIPAGSPTFLLTVNGSSILPCSVVQWNGTTVPTNYVSPTQLTATIPAADVYSAGPGGTPLNVNVTVFTVGPGGGTTAPVIFTITP